MKKQFFRVKQLADQTFLRADKTEALTDELNAVDRRLENLEKVCQAAFKKVKECLVGVGTGVDDASREKRLRKLPMHQMAVAIFNLSESLEDCEPLAKVLRDYGQKGQEMAAEYLEYEVQLEKIFLAPLTKFLDHDFPALAKQKTKLKKLVLDFDGARSRYLHAMKNLTEQSKIDALKEEVEDYQSKVDTCRDNLAGDMYQMLSRESEVAQLIIQMSREQKRYHESSLFLLDRLLPELESNIKENPSQRVWGTPLDEHLRVTAREIALPLEFCVRALLKNGTKEEGLFRIAGGNSKVRRLRYSLDAGVTDGPELSDPHVVASTLKSYLRDLPEPLMTYSMYKDWLKVAEVKEGDGRVENIKRLIDKLPESHRVNLRYLIKFLARLCQSQDVNKMTSQNVAIVMAPNLIWSPAVDSGNNLSLNMNDNGLVCSVIDTLVTHCDTIFPGDENFKRTMFSEFEENIRIDEEVQHAGQHRRHASNEGVVDDRSDASQTSSANHSPTLVPASPRQGPRRKNRTAPVPPRPLKPPPPKPASRGTGSTSGSGPGPGPDSVSVVSFPQQQLQQSPTHSNEVKLGSSGGGGSIASMLEDDASSSTDNSSITEVETGPMSCVEVKMRSKRNDIGFEALEIQVSNERPLSSGSIDGSRATTKPELPERTVAVPAPAVTPPPVADKPSSLLSIAVGEVTVNEHPVPLERKHVRQGSGPPVLPKPAVPGRPSVAKRNSMMEKGSRAPPTRAHTIAVDDQTPLDSSVFVNPNRDVFSRIEDSSLQGTNSPSPPPALPLKQRNVQQRGDSSPPQTEASPPTKDADSPSLKPKPPRPAPPHVHHSSPEDESQPKARTNSEDQD